MNPPALHVSERGIGTVYLSLPIGGFSRARLKFLDCIEAFEKRHTERRLISPSFLLLTGQADFTARVEVDDFRSIVELGFPEYEDPSPSVYNWVFSVAYHAENDSEAEVRIPLKDGVEDARPVAVQQVRDEPRVHFIVHARVLRSFYSSKPVESEATLVHEIRTLFRSVVGLSIETSIGWSDLIVRGAVAGNQFPDLLESLIAFNTFKAGTSDKDMQPLFTRTLTLFGYEWDANPDRIPRVDADVKALVFVRSRYGELHNTKKLIKESIRGASVHVTDGKLDLVGEVPSIQETFFADHAMMAEDQIERKPGNRRAAELIQKMETHLLFGQHRSEDRAVILPHLKLAKCGCSTVLEAMTYPYVTKTLEHALRNVYFLFQSALNDPTNCCDMRPAILACHDGLHRVVGLFNEARARQTESSMEIIEQRAERSETEGSPAAEDQIRRHGAAAQRLRRHTAAVDVAQRRIETWVMLCERVMRQRTIGSFDEFLGQSDRALFYRGGAQKMLFLADCLMNDFYSIAAPPFFAPMWAGAVTPLDRCEFATIYDAVERIESVTGTGFVRVPARNIFKLAAVIPDLWHEVGVHIFFQKVFKDPLDIYDPRESALWRDLGDHFGDLIVWIFGFDCDFVSFAKALLQSWHESVTEGASDTAGERTLDAAAEGTLDPTREMLLSSVFVRLMFVLDMQTWLVDPLERFNGKELLNSILHIIRPYLKRLPITKSSYKEARSSWDSAIYRTQFDELRTWIRNSDVGDRVRKPRKSARDFGDALTAFDEQENLNQVFYELYSEIQNTREGIGERAEKKFSGMAALGRSAVLEYHRRLRPREKQATIFERDLRASSELTTQE